MSTLKQTIDCKRLFVQRHGDCSDITANTLALASAHYHSLDRDNPIRDSIGLPRSVEKALSTIENMKVDGDGSAIRTLIESMSPSSIGTSTVSVSVSQDGDHSVVRFEMSP